MSGKPSRNNYGFYGLASVSPRVCIGNPEKNIKYIEEELDNPATSSLQCIVFPELCVTGYTCGDLFFQDILIERALLSITELVVARREDHRLVIVGLPLLKDGRLFNCALAFSHGEILAVVPKAYIPNYQEFYEERWFASGQNIKNDFIDITGSQIPFGTDIIISHQGANIGIEICEDLWVPVPPSSHLCQAGADIIVNLSATDDNVGKYAYIKSLVSSQSAKCRCGYCYASAGDGESSTDLVFSGINLIADNGKIIAEGNRFSQGSSYCIGYVDIERIRNDRRKYSTFFDTEISLRNYRILGGKYDKAFSAEMELILPAVDPTPFIPSGRHERSEVCKEIVEIQSWGLAQRLKATNCRHLVVGISGGLDSTLALLVAHFTFKKLNIPTENIIGVTMPADATSKRTRSNALELMDFLGVTAMEIPIKEAVEIHFRDIKHDPKELNAVYENSQARERTQILMDLANKYGGMVLGTGDMSELALGWCTYNGDHMSMYNVNGGVPKTLVRYLVEWFADSTENPQYASVLKDIISTPISPELIPAEGGKEISQKTEELIGPYELHDFYLYHVIRNGFSPAKIFFLASIAFKGKYDGCILKHWLVNFYKRFFSQQFKRSCLPDGPKVGSVCLSPRGDWRMPSDASAALWIQEAESIQVPSDK